MGDPRCVTEQDQREVFGEEGLADEGERDLDGIGRTLKKGGGRRKLSRVLKR